MDELTRKLAIVFEATANLQGVDILDGGYHIISDAEFGFSGKYVNYYLALSTLSKMAMAGDIKFEIISDASKKEYYLTKLLSEIQ
jgi:hypothetical protein